MPIPPALIRKYTLSSVNDPISPGLCSCRGRRFGRGMITEDNEDVFRKHNQAQSLAINSPQRRTHRYRLVLLLSLVVVRMVVSGERMRWLGDDGLGGSHE